MANVQVDSPNVTYTDRYIEADYDYCTTRVDTAGGKYKVHTFRQVMGAAMFSVRSMRGARFV